MKEDYKYLEELTLLLGKIAYWARKYPELYTPGEARDTVANHLAKLFQELDEFRKKN